MAKKHCKGSLSCFKVLHSRKVFFNISYSVILQPIMRMCLKAEPSTYFLLFWQTERILCTMCSCKKCHKNIFHSHFVSCICKQVRNGLWVCCQKWLRMKLTLNPLVRCVSVHWYLSNTHGMWPLLSKLSLMHYMFTFNILEVQPLTFSWEQATPHRNTEWNI